MYNFEFAVTKKSSSIAPFGRNGTEHSLHLEGVVEGVSFSFEMLTKVQGRDRMQDVSLSLVGENAFAEVEFSMTLLRNLIGAKEGDVVTIPVTADFADMLASVRMAA